MGSSFGGLSCIGVFGANLFFGCSFCMGSESFIVIGLECCATTVRISGKLYLLNALPMVGN